MLLLRPTADRLGEANDHRERDEPRDQLVTVVDRRGDQDQQDRQRVDGPGDPRVPHETGRREGTKAACDLAWAGKEGEYDCDQADGDPRLAPLSVGATA